ncbi:MAG: hypothetical protein IJK72_01365 [Mycoplasma sp.]|nr:hypothetical protein [Mycoplasma sp.]
MKINKITKKIKVTENDFKDFSSIATIPEHFEKKYGIIYNNMARSARW